MRKFIAKSILFGFFLGICYLCYIDHDYLIVMLCIIGLVAFTWAMTNFD